MYRSIRLLAIATLAAVCAVAAFPAAVVDRVSWCSRRLRSAALGLTLWLVEQLPRAAQWLRPDVGMRVAKDTGIAMRQVPRRRPMVTPRFRMCPST